jgi:hypothetical protein
MDDETLELSRNPVMSRALQPINPKSPSAVGAQTLARLNALERLKDSGEQSEFGNLVDNNRGRKLEDDERRYSARKGSLKRWVV